ncbi:hypothetical protein GALMADRAFT_235382 [Galerina marginata CBS 339.88]|uniref:DUF6534 domain-containing protein n=1 Tax=Galerina marginata (strain CBS 339.88) TaxID=685588 RepID=A0A067TUW9_GALM3|nr:hypothetical protein GALMADRAFT_235382 [Galerina marginata CBS 339.88]
MNPALKVFGPLLIGAFINTILYGVCVVQFYIYYQKYKRDSKRIRYLVLYLFIMETINTIIIVGVVFEPLVLNFGNPQVFIAAPRMIPLDALSTVLISTPVQFFAAWRIKVIGQSIVLPLIIGFLGACAFIGATTLSVCVLLDSRWASFGRLDHPTIVWLTASAVVDVLITGSLFWSLRRRKTGIKATDDRVSKIVRATIQTGLITTIFASLDLILVLTVKGITVNFVWDLPLSKLYVNSLLSTLNVRDGWNGNLAIPSSGDPDPGPNTRIVKPVRLTSIAFVSNTSMTTRFDEDDIELGSLKSAGADHKKDFV